jgi:DNA polymerase I
LRVVFDIEANSLKNPTKIWVIVCKDVDTGITHTFRRVSDEEDVALAFRSFARDVLCWVGHNCIAYDLVVMHNLLGLNIPLDRVVDTYIISKLVDYSRDGHSIESYGLEFGLEKINFTDFSKYSLEMETYCVRDVEICHRIYSKHSGIINDRDWRTAIDTEQRFQVVCGELHSNGFGFNVTHANRLHNKVTKELEVLDKAILEQFPPKQVILRYFTPRATKFGTINRTSVPRSLWHEIENYKVGETYPVYSMQEFNPASHKQVITVLNEAGWAPVDKTKTHIEWERQKTEKIDKPNLLMYGWKINETNLNTLPPKAPAPARTLAKRILIESRRRTLVEWLGLVGSDERIHGKFLSIGAWTHRMAHQEPNTANIPNDVDTQGKPRLYGGEMRSLWCAPPGQLLIGVDAEGIQLRIFAHYIDDKEFTNALVKGSKSNQSDPHSLNKRILGSVCKSRAAAKRFIYALLLGAGIKKLAEVLESTESETKEALARLLGRYEGFARLKKTIIPKDAKRGYFIGLDGRKVQLLGDTESEKRHLAMSGYLQNGEAVVMKHATLIWHDRLISKNIPFKLVNMVHDEWQTECPNDMDIALAIAKEQCSALEETGRILKLKCPLAGSYETDGKITIGDNWKVTH